MSELRYPNESREYRDARDSLLKDEQELVDKVKSVAERRRNLPPGGQLKEDYVFQWANDGKVGKSVKFSDLFADKNTLLLYSFMYGPNWDNPCLSCTSLVDGFDRSWYQVSRDAAGHRHARHEQPVADQQRARHEGLEAPARDAAAPDHQERGQQVADRDPLEDARDAQGGQVEPRQGVQEQAEREDRERSP